MPEIARLDRWTLFNIYFRARDKEGRLILQAKGKDRPASDRELFYNRYRRWGVADWRIDPLWQAELDRLREEAAKADEQKKARAVVKRARSKARG